VRSSIVRVLFVADTHLGFDFPFQPRVKRRRRGSDFFANFEKALQPAHEGKVDLVVHGGDLFFRSKVPPALVQMAFAPLTKVADLGVPVFLVPGNHERSKIPLHLWAVHPNLYIFDKPRTFKCDLQNGSIALSGFPFTRKIKDHFHAQIAQTGYQDISAGIHLLCMHQTVEGAQVGPSDFTFRHGADVIPGANIPGDFAAVLSGHIHRSQMLTHDLRGNPLAAPVIYPGSVERTSFAERKEDKHYVMMGVTKSGRGVGELTEVSFLTLPTRPMHTIVIDGSSCSGSELATRIRQRLSQVNPDAIVRIRIRGGITDDGREVLRAASLRSLAPPSMNVSLSFDSRSILEDKSAT
jgi:exonuclease SbcD